MRMPVGSCLCPTGCLLATVRSLLPILLACIALTGCSTGAPEHPRSVDRHALGAFQFFRSQQERMPPQLQRHFGMVIHPRDASDFVPQHVQRVSTTRGVIWAFLDGPDMCIGETLEGSIACSDRRVARIKGVSLGLFRPPSTRIPRPHNFRMIAIMPDQVEAVVAIIGKRPPDIKKVSHNIVAISAARPILLKQLIR